MAYRYDEKGKIFTDVISKEAIWVILQTPLHRILGQVHIRSGARLKDELNQGEQFLAVTDAVISDCDGTELFRSAFLTLNRDHILWVIPANEIHTDAAQAGGGV